MVFGHDRGGGTGIRNAEHEAALADFKSVEETVRLNELLTTRHRELESRVAEWESLSAELEA